jgi:raffinose/stachyose/melibiose transport system permease protein
MLSRAERLASWAVIILGTIITLYPLLAVLSTAFEPPNQTSSGISFVHPWSLSSFSYAWNVGDFREYLFNTALVTVSVMVVATVLAILAAYGVSVLKPKGARLVLYLGILGFMLPTEALIVPWYYQLTSLHFVDTYWAMILPQIAQSVAFGTFWLTTAYAAVPKVFSEAAALDGASDWKLLTRIHLPSIMPAIKTMAALVFLWTWNGFLLPLVMESNPARYVVTIGLSSFQGDHFANYGALAAGSIITALPVVFVYLFAQRSFIAGMFAGSVVE